MTKVALYNTQGEKTEEITLPESVFGLPSNHDLVHQVYVAQTANRRSGSAHTKVRSDIRGGGKKPWKQKGTGNARTGSIRNPIWRGGGTIFGPSKDKNYTKDINTKMRRKALLTVLSEKARGGKLVVCDSLVMESVKTKEFNAMTTALGLTTSRTVGLVPAEKQTYKAARNIPKTRVMETTKLNVMDLLDTDILMVSRDGITEIEKHFTA